MPFTRCNVSVLAVLLGLAACATEDSPADDEQGGSSAASQEVDKGESEPGEEPSADDDSASDASAKGETDASTGPSRDAEVGSPSTPAACKLPFEGGACDAYFEVWAYDASKDLCVQRVYGGCGGNENRFATREECEESCFAAEAGANKCPPNTRRAEVCLSCGLVGGCAEMAVQCALTCDEDSDCKGGNEWPTSCYKGVCQVFGCI